MTHQSIGRFKALMLSVLFNRYVWIFALSMAYIYGLLFIYGDSNIVTFRLMMNAKRAGDVTIQLIDIQKDSKIIVFAKNFISDREKGASNGTAGRPWKNIVKIFI